MVRKRPSERKEALMDGSTPGSGIAQPGSCDPVPYLRGLQHLICQQRRDYILARTRRVQRRKGRLLASSTAWLVIAMSLFATHSIPMVWRALPPYPTRPTPTIRPSPKPASDWASHRCANCSRKSRCPWLPSERRAPSTARSD